ncbi:MAG: peptidylprolyl isomerase [Anaerolineae bacterium]
MAKKQSTKKRLTRRQVARREREARAEKVLTLVAIGVGAVVLFLLAYGLITEVFIEARRPVARVGEETITTKEFQARQSYERWMTELEIFQYQSYLDQLELSAQQNITGTTGTDEGTSDDNPLIQQLQITISNLQRQLSPDLANVYAGRILDEMIEEELVRQEAETRGLTAAEDEIQQRIELTLGYDREAATTPVTDTASITDTSSIDDSLTGVGQQPAFEDLYDQFEENVLEVTRYPEEDFRAMVRADVLRERLVEVFAEDVPEVQDQVQAIVFILETEEAAESVRARINVEEEEPGAVVEELTNDESDTTAGFELPWLPLGYIGTQISTEVERVAFNTPVGRASEPIPEGEDRYYVVYVSGHEERELSSELLDQAEQQAYETWLAEAKDEQVEYLEWEDAVVAE